MKLFKTNFSQIKKPLILFLSLFIVFIYVFFIKPRFENHIPEKNIDRKYLERLKAIQSVLSETQTESKETKSMKENDNDINRIAEYELFYQKGIAYYREGRIVDAIHCFEKSIKAKDTKEARTLISQLYNFSGMKEIENKNYDNAIKLFEKSFANLKNNQSLLGIANAFISKGDLDNSLLTLEKSLDIYPENSSVYYHFGQIYYQKGEIKKAMNYLQKSLELNPHDMDAKTALNNAKVHLGINDNLVEMSINNFIIDSKGEHDEIVQNIILTLLEQTREKVLKSFNISPSSKIKILFDFDIVFKSENLEPNENIIIDAKEIKIPAAGLDKVTDTFLKAIIYSYTKLTLMDYMNGRCPVWFLEGISLYESDKTGSANMELLHNMVKSEQFIKLEEINSALKKPDNKTHSLGYAASFSVVEYIIEKYGIIEIQKIISRVRSGLSFEESIMSVFSFSLLDLQNNWENYMKEKYMI